jgi:hypothetical protein
LTGAGIESQYIVHAAAMDVVGLGERLGEHPIPASHPPGTRPQDTQRPTPRARAFVNTSSSAPR